jgi:hypothetical protein
MDHIDAKYVAKRSFLLKEKYPIINYYFKTAIAMLTQRRTCLFDPIWHQSPNDRL